MKLKEYLKINNIKAKDFAEKIGVTPAYVTLIHQGKRWPRVDLMRRITEATDGQVTANDFAAVEEQVQ